MPKSSGRGLGHTGGTIDKLESIPGFRVAMERDAFLAALQRIGCAFIGQTADIAPADKKLYALRDVTGTIESIPLIASSIMSKKIAEGTDVLVLDVKVGRGAFMKTEADARRLAEAMVTIGARVGLETEAMLTAMDAPLGRAIGNALEIGECLDTLAGRGPSDLEHLCVALAARMLRLAGAGDDREAEARVRRALASGAALEKFGQVVENQGGDRRIIEDRARLPHVAAAASVHGCAFRLRGRDGRRAHRPRVDGARRRPRAPRHADRSGRGARAAGQAGGPGRGGDPIVRLHPGAGARSDEARELLARAVTISAEPPPPVPLIHGIVR